MRAALAAQEVLDENRFVAARDGVEAKLIEPRLGRAVPVRELVPQVVEACRPHARVLRCESELEHIALLTERPPAARQVLQARGRAAPGPRAVACGGLHGVAMCSRSSVPGTIAAP